MRSLFRVFASILLFSVSSAYADEIIAFNYSVGGAVPAPETRNIISTGAPLSISMTAGGGAWLQASLSATVTPAELTIAIKPEGLAIGAYQDFINLTAGPVNTLAYSIRLNVTAGGTAAPVITVSTASLNLMIAEGETHYFRSGSTSPLPGLRLTIP